MLSRDLGEMVRAAKAAFNLPDADVTLPTKLLYPLDFYPVISKEHQELDDKFVGVLEQLLGVKAERIDLAETWGKKTPKEANGQSLHEYLSEVSAARLFLDFFPILASLNLHFTRHRSNLSATNSTTSMTVSAKITRV